MPEPTLFKCPICGNGEYATVRIVSPAILCSPAVVLHYICTRCSVMFADPRKFTDVKGMSKYPNGHVETKPEIPAGIPHGYQPIHCSLDKSNPPQGSSGVPKMETTLSCETTVPAQASTCPVCHGTGHVDAGFDMSNGISWSSAGGTETCKSCNGKGYVVIKWHKN